MTNTNMMIPLVLLSTLVFSGCTSQVTTEQYGVAEEYCEDKGGLRFVSVYGSRDNDMFAHCVSGDSDNLYVIRRNR